MSLTNKGLVDYANKVLALGDDTIYVYGSFGNTLTESFINQKAKQYAYNLPRKSIYKKCMNSGGTEYAFDCVGLIKSYIWGGYGKVKYNSAQDKSANGMLSASKVKGKINTMPQKLGILVHMDGHIGIYIGNGYVIESTPNTKFAKQNHGGGGVCRTKLSDRKWTSWCECPFITYESTPVNYYPKCDSKHTSIVNALKSINVDSSFSNRGKIAKTNGIKNYIGTSMQNITMLNLLKQGKLKK